MTIQTLEPPRLKARKIHRPQAVQSPTPLDIPPEQAVSEELAKLAPKNAHLPPPKKLAKIIDAACKVCGITLDDLVSSRRAVGIVMARQIISVLGHQHTTYSYPIIAKAISRPNHSTLITSAQKYASDSGRVVTIGELSMTRYGWLIAVKLEAGLC